MPRKPFEDQPYNPIEADLARDAAAPARPLVGGQDHALFHGEAPTGGTIIEHPRAKRNQAKLTLPASLGSKSEVGKRFSLTRDEDLDLAEFLRRLQRQSGTKVALSLLIRASLTLIMHAEAEILTQIRKSPPRVSLLHMTVWRMQSLNTTGCSYSLKPYAIPVLSGRGDLKTSNLEFLQKKFRLKKRSTELQKNNCTKEQLYISPFHPR